MDACLDQIFNHPWWYLIAVLLSLFVGVLLARPSIITFYDPWALQQIPTAFASADIIFMWYKGIIESYIAAYYILATSVFFICASLSFRKMTRIQFVQRAVSVGHLNVLRSLTLFIFVSVQLIAWALAGLPILLESRLDSFAGGGGIGILSRIISFTSIAVIFLTVLRIGTSPLKKVNLTDCFVLIFSIISSVVNGSKTNIIMIPIIIMMSHWISLYNFRGYVAPSIPKKYFTLIGVLITLLLFVPLYFEIKQDTQSKLNNPLEGLIFRLILSGDVYMWFYGDHFDQYIEVNSPTALLFSDFLGVTRLLPWDKLPIHPGVQIYKHLFPDSGAIRGPNMRVDIFGLLYGNMFVGFIVSALIGCFFGFIRSLIFRVKSGALFLPAVYLFFQAPFFLVDPLLGVTAVVNACFLFFLVMLMIKIIRADPFGKDATIIYAIKRTNTSVSNPI